MPINLTARVKEIGELQQLRRTQKPDIFKIMIDFEVEETREVFYGEIRNGGIKILEREGVEVGSLVNVEITFEGQKKLATNNKFNNLLISKIKVLE